MSKDKPVDVVEAGEFRLTDGEGKVRARIFLEDDEPKIALFSRDGKKRAAIGLLPTGEAGLALYDDRGKYHFLINVSPEGEPDLSITDKYGRELYNSQPQEKPGVESEILPHVKNKGLRWLLKK
ncbi:MAG TPA: hypothetical protein VKA70_19685 [Blastocatellia bacterium]|nr:hypothetical protein [Blastocatellia bacterium]